MKTLLPISVIALALLSLSATSLHAADGDLDPAFQPSSVQGARLATQSDGRVLLTVLSGSTHKLARLNADGTLDAAFPAGAINGLVSSVGVQSDDRIIIAGSFTTVGGAAAGPVARLNVDGSLDTAFTPPASGGFISRIQVLPGDKILAASVDAPRLQRLNADGTPDPTFVVDASIALNSNPPAAVLADGGLIVAYVPADNVTRLARLTATGATNVKYQFAPGALANTAGLPQLAADPEDRVLVYGSTVIGDNLNPANYTPFLRRFNVDGSLDTTFAPPVITGAALTGSNQRPGIDVAIASPGGGVLVGGNFTALNGTPEPGIARLAEDGTVDTAFAAGGGQFGGGSNPPEIHDLLLQSGNLLVTGSLAPATGDGEGAGGIGTARLLLLPAVIAPPPPPADSAELSGKVKDFKAKRSADGSKLKIKGELIVRNKGAMAAKNVEVGAFVSADKTQGDGDVEVGSISLTEEGFKKLAKKNGVAGPIPFNFKLTAAEAALVSGKYVLVVIDPANAIQEADKTDNVIVLGPLP